MFGGNTPLETKEGKRNLLLDDPCFTELRDKLRLLKELLFLVEKAIPGTSETLPTEHGITGFILA